MNVEQRRRTTVDRRLAALRNFFTWAKASELLEEPPTDSVQGVGSSSQSPRSLEKPEVGKLIRAVERHGNKRDLAIVLTLRHTGIRVSEFCSVTLSDIELSERKGSVIVRSGKGSKYRVLPLNVDARRAIADYLRVRLTVETACLFVKLVRRLIHARGQTVPIGQLEAMAGKTARDYIDFLATLGVAEHCQGGVALTRSVDSIGPSLEWYVARLCHEELGGKAEWSVRLKDLPVGGDYSAPTMLQRLRPCIQHYNARVKGRSAQGGLPVNFVTGKVGDEL